MDDLLREFLTETHESLDTVDNQLVRFEQDPNNARILDNIFRLVHTMKGTCGQGNRVNLITRRSGLRDTRRPTLRFFSGGGWNPCPGPFG